MAAEPRRSLAICDDGEEWPPYTFHRRPLGEVAEVTGMSVELIDTILAKHGMRAHVVLIPWARCQEEIKSNRYQMALNAAFSEKRAAEYWLTRPVYQTHSHYFYSRKRFPQGLHIESADDLRRYRACGVFGYSYAAYGYAEGEVEQGAKTFVALIEKLHLGRCDLFPEQREIMEGFAAVGKNYLSDPDLISAPIPGARPTDFHMMVSRAWPEGERMRQLIDEELVALEKSGRYKRIMRKYFPQ